MARLRVKVTTIPIRYYDIECLLIEGLDGTVRSLCPCGRSRLYTANTAGQQQALAELDHHIITAGCATYRRAADLATRAG